MNKHTNDLNLDSRFVWAIESLKATKLLFPEIKTVFDIGSANEILAEQVRDMGLIYHSFDLFPPNNNVRKWNIEEPFPYEGSADVIIFLEVIEHLNNPWLGIKNIIHALNPGGHIFISTPNPAWSHSTLHLLSHGVLGMFSKEDLRLNHHVFTPWQHIVEFMLQDNGLGNIRFTALGKKTSVGAYPFWGLKLPLRIFFRLLKKIIEQTNTNAIGALYGVQAQKKDE